MKWFKHDSNAMADAKLKRIRMKYGMQGYGLYWYCLELIAQNVEKHNLNFELEHDAEIISMDTGIHQELVEEMMKYMVKINLFESSKGRIYCLKMATRTDEYTQKLLKLSLDCPDSNPRMSRQSPEAGQIKSELIEENRTEENRTEKKEKFIKPSLQDVTDYCAERNNGINAEGFIDHYEANGWVRGKTKIRDWRACVRTWEKNHKQLGGPEVWD